MMNVAIVGNSNCVFRNGFSLGVSRYVSMCGGVVRNYSLGGSCCALHIYTLHDRYFELCDSDLVIVDSHVIDSFHLRRKIVCENEIVSLIDDLYALYSQLPGKVISVLFPVETHVSNYTAHLTYMTHIRCAKKYGVDVLDLYSALPPGLTDYSLYFMQPGHLRSDIACEVGYRLAKECYTVVSKDIKVTPLVSPYQVIKRELFSKLEAVPVKSSYYAAICYRLDRELPLENLRGKHLIGALHWNKTSNSRFVVSTGGDNDIVQFRSKYAFFEVLNTRRKIESNTWIRPGGINEEVTQKAAGKKRLAVHGVPQLIGLLVRERERSSVREVGAHADLSDRYRDLFG